ncbi:unnamed protein product [Caretta caretta]
METGISSRTDKKGEDSYFLKGFKDATGHQSSRGINVYHDPVRALKPCNSHNQNLGHPYGSGHQRQLEWGDRVYFSHLTVRTAGVVTLFFPDLQPEVLGVAKAVSGHLLHLRVRMEGLEVNLVKIYAVTSGLEWLRFYQQASAFLGTLDPHECLVLGRYFNTTLKEQDRSGTEQCPATGNTTPWWTFGATTTRMTFQRSPLSGWRPVSRATPSWTASIYHVSTFPGPTPSASSRPCSLIII